MLIIIVAVAVAEEVHIPVAATVHPMCSLEQQVLVVVVVVASPVAVAASHLETTVDARAAVQTVVENCLAETNPEKSWLYFPNHCQENHPHLEQVAVLIVLHLEEEVDQIHLL